MLHVSIRINISLLQASTRVFLGINRTGTDSQHSYSSKEMLRVSTQSFERRFDVSTTVRVKATYLGCVFCTISRSCHTIDGLIKMCHAEICHIFLKAEIDSSH